MTKTSLVTGAAGFLGSHLCRRLLQEGYCVYALDNLYTGSEANLSDFSASPDFHFLEADVIDTNAAWFASHGLGDVHFDEIYNLACPASPVHYQARPLFTTKTSIFGMLNMLELAKAQGARLLHTSTSEIYGDPLVHPQVESYWGNVNTIGIRSCYDEGKRVAETLAADYIREFDVDVRMVRIFNTYGPYMHPQDGRVISNFIMQALHNEDITIYGDGSQTRSFQYCDDLIEAFRRYMSLDKSTIRAFFDGKSTTPSIVQPPAPNLQPSTTTVQPSTSNLQPLVQHPAMPVLNTGNPGEYTIKELAETVIQLLNHPSTPTPTTYTSLSTPVGPARRAGRNQTATHDCQPQPPTSTSSKIVYRPLPSDDPKKRKPDITLAHELLGGWEPKVPLAEGLAKTIEYFRGRFG